jgi:hypothetical protein
MSRWKVLILALCVTLTACQHLARLRTPAEPVASLEDPLQEESTATDLEAPPIPDTVLPMSPEQRFADVPLPANVNEQLDKSYVFETEGMQIGRIVYTSRATVNELAQFYIKEAPAAGWKLARVIQTGGAELVFTKPDRRLDVTIQPGRFPLFKQKLILHLTPSVSE